MAREFEDMSEPSAAPRGVLSFGRFELVPSERLLVADGARIDLGARTLDILIALTSRPNEPIGKRELTARVWPDVIVEEGSLRFHIAALRKALGDGKEGARYIATLAGRGYCFVAPVTRANEPGANAGVVDATTPRGFFLPARLTRMVGRDNEIRAISAALSASRFVSIVGPGGAGKTTVAVAVAHELLRDFNGDALFVDFGLVTDPRVASSSVASMMGLSIQSDDPTPSLIGLLRERRMLLVLDTCEHIVEEVARLTERLFLAAPQLHILTTSREALRVEGKRVHRLALLEVPPDDATLTLEDTLAFPAARLFVERATAAGARPELVNEKAPTVASICRRLDGLALAIELAAGRIAAYGLEQTAALLDQRFALLWQGQRTAPARQKTLQATLEWSYGLLPESERIVFRRLAVFIGPFTIEAALEVVADEVIDAAWIFTAIDSLVAKSMVSLAPVGAMMRYRLLDTARAYALEISDDPAERKALAARHVSYCLRWLEPFEADGSPLPNKMERGQQLVGVNNVRAALEWCFGPGGDTALGVRLASAATFALLALSLTSECLFWSRRAIELLDETSRGGAEEMHLQTGFALSAMFTRGNREEARIALNKSLAIADERADAFHQINVLSLLHMYQHRAGDAREAHALVTRSLSIASKINDTAAEALARAQLGISLTLAGDLNGARVEFEAARRRPEIFLQGFDYRVIASGYLARVLWLQGYPEQAAECLRANVAGAASAGRPVSLSFALSFAVPLLLWLGDLAGAEEQLEWFVSHNRSHSLPLSLAAAGGFRGQLAISRGHAKSGVAILEESLRDLGEANYNVWDTSFNIARAQGLFALDRFVESLALVEDTLRQTKENGDLTYIPELLRIKAKVFGSLPLPRASRRPTSGRRNGCLKVSSRTRVRVTSAAVTIDLAHVRGKGARCGALHWLNSL
jgi:predicted ATPase/DNA-binding winged helix-turn-helix (wHTH) protein